MVERSSDTIERSPAESGSEVTDQSVELADVVGAAAAPPVRTYVVQPHDTLWSIAGSQLGSPLLWPEIAQANYGRPQPDGGVLTDAHWIDPGWVLILPAGASAADTASPSPMSTPVAPAAAPPPSAQVAPTPSTTPSPTPTTLPTPAAAAPTSTTVAPTPTTAPPSPTNGLSPSPSVSRSSRAQADQVGTAHLVHRQDETPDGQAGEGHGGLPLTPIGAGLLGAGLVGIIDRMRRAQQRHRRVGEHIRLPHPALSRLERRLRISDDPLAPYAVDAALRTFASGYSTATSRTSAASGASVAGRPVVAGVQVHPDDIELVPEDDQWTGTVPGPFESRLGSSSWFVARRLLPWPDPGATEGTCDDEAPCPALVTVGRSDAGPCLVNLEAMGSLAVSGEPAACDGLLRALALELATSFWADQFDLVLVGFGQELSRFERVRVVPGQRPLSSASSSIGDAMGALSCTPLVTDHSARPAWRQGPIPGTRWWCCAVPLSVHPRPKRWSIRQVTRRPDLPSLSAEIEAVVVTGSRSTELDPRLHSTYWAPWSGRSGWSPRSSRVSDDW